MWTAKPKKISFYPIRSSHELQREEKTALNDIRHQTESVKLIILLSVYKDFNVEAKNHAFNLKNNRMESVKISVKLTALHHNSRGLINLLI